MNIWAFDLGLKTGVAMGAPPDDLSKLTSYSIQLHRRKDDHILWDVAQIKRSLETFLDDALRAPDNKPQKIIFEAPLSPNTTFNDERPRGDMAMLLPSNLAVAIITWAEDHDVSCELVYPATYRTTFIGKPNDGERKSTKDRVIEAAKLWGYVPDTCKDDNRCDAIGMWHWAQKKFGKWQPPVEVMFGQRVKIAKQPSPREAAEALFKTGAG